MRMRIQTRAEKTDSNIKLSTTFNSTQVARYNKLILKLSAKTKLAKLDFED